MSVSNNPSELVKVIDSLMDELDQLASTAGTTSNELFDRAAETVDAVVQPLASAIFIFGPDGVPCNTNRSEPIQSFFPTWMGTLNELETSPDGFVAEEQKKFASLGFAIKNKTTMEGVLVAKIDKTANSQAVRSLMKAIADLISRFISVQLSQSDSSSSDFLKHVNEFSVGCMSTLNELELAKVIVNDSRMLLECERTQIFKSASNRLALIAVSSVAVFVKRTELLRCSARIAKHACKLKTPILSSQVSNNKHVQMNVDEYRELSGMPFFAFFPLQAKFRGRKPSKPCGVLLAEFAEPPRFFEFVRAANIVIPQASAAISNAQKISAIPLHRTLLFLSNTLNLKSISRLLLYLVLPGILLFLAFTIQTDFKVRMTGTLRPAVEQLVFSPDDAFVANVLVEQGDAVNQGQLLVELRSPSLNLELEEADAEIRKLTEFKAAKVIALNQASTGNTGDRSTQAQLASEVADLQYQIISFQDKRNYTRRRIDELQIYSPIAGKVVTWNVKKMLHEKPVRWGDPLLKIADEAGDWELRFKASENKIGYILGASKNKNGDPNDLDVEYFFHSNPDQKFTTTIRDIADSTEMDAEVGPSVATNCEIDPKQQLKRHGAKAIGDVICGKRSIAYVWTYELVDAIRRQLVW